MIDIPINNLALAINTILGMFACSLFIVKGIAIGLDTFKEYLK